MTTRTPQRIAKYVILSILAIIVLFGSWFTVSQTEVAVLKTFGKMNDTVYGPGPHLKMPLFASVVKFNIQTNKDTATALAASKDLQKITAEVAINYAIDQSKVKDIYTNLGNMDQVASKVVTPSIQETVKAVTAKYTAEELIGKRNQVSLDIVQGLKEKLAQYDIRVVDVNIINFEFSPEFDQSIEKKVRAEQDALASKNQLEQVKYEAQQQIEKAKAEAETIRIQSEAITKQGGAEYIQLKWIEKWKGDVPSTQVGNSPVMFQIPLK